MQDISRMQDSHLFGAAVIDQKNLILFLRDIQYRQDIGDICAGRNLPPVSIQPSFGNREITPEI